MKLPLRRAWLLPFLLAALLVPTGQAKVAFYETTVVSDTADDFASNGALDVVALHLGEKFSYDLDSKSGVDVVDFRIEVRLLTEMQNLGGQVVRYDVRLKADGTDKNATVSASWPVSVTGTAPKPTLQGPGFSTSDSIVVRMDAASLGLAPFSSITSVWASTSLVNPGSIVAQDLAPFDNMNAPTPPSATPDPSASYTVIGGYPFVRVESTSPSTGYSVLGDEVSFGFRFTLAEGITGDRVIVLFPSAPAGWDITPSKGTTGPPPQGEISNADAATPMDFSFSVKNDDRPDAGQNVPFVMEVITLSGGHVVIEATVIVSEEKIVRDEYVITLQTPGPFKAEAGSVLTAQVSHAVEGPLTTEEVSADFLLAGKLQATVVGTTKGGGTFEFAYTFPTPGDWTVDVFVSELAPSPHKEFVVQVEKKGGLAPAPSVLLVALGLLVVAGLRRP